MTDPLVRFEAVHKVFKGKTVIGEVHLQAGRGEVVALCGGNGAGKSTLIRMLAGILRPTRGTITVDGLRWEDDRKRYAQQIGYMPDDYRFSAGLTALETMLFWARLRGLGKKEARELLARVGLEDTGTKPVASFSKGMRQRVLFAQVLLAKPPLIVMDEPTNGLIRFGWKALYNMSGRLLPAVKRCCSQPISLRLPKRWLTVWCFCAMGMSCSTAPGTSCVISRALPACAANLVTCSGFPE